MRQQSTLLGLLVRPQISSHTSVSRLLVPLQTVSLRRLGRKARHRYLVLLQVEILGVVLETGAVLEVVEVEVLVEVEWLSE
jgi:hypothetical protein